MISQDVIEISVFFWYKNSNLINFTSNHRNYTTKLELCGDPRRERQELCYIDTDT